MQTLSQQSLARRQEWSIGIYVGSSLYNLKPPTNVVNPVLTRTFVTDAAARFVADPFMLNVDRTWYMFFEIFNRQTHKGEIGLASSRDGLAWHYQSLVLVEPFHLSYPYVFEWEQEYYLIPESHKDRSVRLYKAAQFPGQWQFVATLLDGANFADTSIFRHADRWWLLTETSPGIKFDTLRLYYADDLMGPWIEHPQSPVVMGNSRSARPAGRILTVDGRIIRFAQDCYPTYGRQVYAFEITELTTTRYSERKLAPRPLLTRGSVGWNAGGMHHIDAHRLDDGQWLTCVDGWRIRP
jgi:hypothetical protein